MESENTQPLLPAEAWVRGLTGHELAAQLEHAFARGGQNLSPTQRDAVVAEAVRRLRRSVGEMHRDSEAVPEKFREW